MLFRSAGRVDAAVVSWTEGDGLGRAAWQTAGQTGERWRFAILARTPATQDQVEQALEEAGEDWVADTIALGGGTETDLHPATMRMDLLEHTRLPFDAVRGLLAYAVFSVGLLAFFLLTLPAVADRREGVTETLRVLPIRPGRMVTARVLALVSVQLVASVFVLLNLAILALPALSSLDLPRPPWERLPGLVASVAMANAGYALVGTVSPSARIANSTSSIPMTLQLGLLVFGVLGSPPVWVPMAGVLVAGTWFEHVVAFLSTVAATIAILRVCGWLLETRVSLVLRRGDD